jgi:hypothetical protein
MQCKSNQRRLRTAACGLAAFVFFVFVAGAVPAANGFADKKA